MTVDRHLRQKSQDGFLARACLKIGIGGLVALIIFGAIDISAHNLPAAPNLHQNLESLESLVEAYARSPHNREHLKRFRSQISIARKLHDANSLEEAQAVVETTYRRVKRDLVTSKTRVIADETTAQASRKNTNEAAAQARAIIILEGRKATIEALLLTHKIALIDLGTTYANHTKHLNERARTQAELTEADALISKQHLDDATTVLIAAQSRITSLISDIRNGQTLVRKLDLRTAEKRYRYEQDRFTAYIRLLSHSLARSNVSEKTSEKIEVLRQQALTNQDLATQFGSNKKFELAETAMEDGNTLLLKAVALTGQITPR